MDTFKTVLFHKLTLRLLYIVTAYSTAHIVALAASPKATAVLSNAGVLFQVTDPLKLKTAITALMLFGGEFVYHFVHEKFVIPQVTKNSAPEVK